MYTRGSRGITKSLGDVVEGFLEEVTFESNLEGYIAYDKNHEGKQIKEEHE